MLKILVQSLFAKTAVAVINLLLLIISSHYLGISSRGEISIFILNIAIVQIISEIYTGYSLIHFVPKFKFKQMYFYGLLFTFCFTVLVNGIFSVLNKHITGFSWQSYVVSAFMILHTFQCVLLLGRQKVAYYNLLCLLQPFLLLCGLLFYIFVLNDFTFKAFVYPLLFSFLLSFILSLGLIIHFGFNSLGHLPLKLKPIFNQGFINQIGILLFFFSNRYSFYILSDKDKVGLYSTASVLTESVLIIANSVAPILLSKVANETDSGKNIKLTLSLSKISFLLSLLALCILLLLPEHLFIRVLGKEFGGIKTLIFLYAPGVLLVSIFSLINNYFSATGQNKMVLYSHAAGFVTVIVSVQALVRLFDVKGAAYAADIAYLMMAAVALSMFLINSKLGLDSLIPRRHDLKAIREIFHAI